MQHYPLVTIVGGSGFVGRHTVRRFVDAGYRVRVLVRDTVKADFLKTSATVGSIAIEHVDMTKPKTLEGKLAGSDIVVNLVSIAYESGRQKFNAINVDGAKAVAEEARKAGARAFVQISALGADRMPDTQYGSTKLAGENAVKAAFPNATILRPSLIVGPEDGFFQRFARMSLALPVLPLIAGGKTLFQPVLVTDVAEAIFIAAVVPEYAGKTYAIAGTETFSMRQMLERMAQITNRRPCLISIPSCAASIKGFFCELLPLKPMITRDQVKMLRHDNVITDGELTMRDMGITPSSVNDALPNLLSRFIKQ